MIDRKIGKIKVRRGTDSQRVTNTFEEGEVIYSVDKKRIFVGDDTTLGGVPVCNRNYIVESLGFPPVLPDEVLEGDIIFDKLSSSTYITTWTGTEYELLLIGDGNCCIQLQLQIDDLYTKLTTMTGCLDGTPPPRPPDSKLSWVIQPINNFVDIGDTVTFTASAVGDGAISYVWKRIDGLTINTPNIYKNSITITNVSILDIADYYCVASNSVDSITSVNVVLDVESDSILAEDGTYTLSELNEFIDWEEDVVELTITKQPVSVSTNAGASVTFSVEAMGSPPITYQWKIGGVDVVGETKSTYTITNPTVDINNISCKVSNPAGDVFSNSANLTILKEKKWIQLGQDIDGEAAGDYSGHSVSMNSAGDRVAIGAYRNAGNGTYSGHVRIYSYDGSTWTQLGADINGEAAGDESGNSVSMNSTGDRVAIGAILNDGNGSASGHVRIYSYNSGIWTQLGQDIDGEALGDESGYSVSMNSAGDRVAIGAYKNDGNANLSGHVRIYSHNGSSWTQLGADINGETGNDQSGWSVSMNSAGDRVAIGAILNDGNGSTSGHVRIYSYNGSSWTQLGQDINGEAAGDNSGWSVSMNSAGDRVAIGARFNAGNGVESGHVRVYSYNGSSWTQLGQDINGEAAGDRSGWSVSINSAGDRVAIGAYLNDGNGAQSGHVRVFQYK